MYRGNVGESENVRGSSKNQDGEGEVIQHETTDYGYGDEVPDTSDLGYGDARPDSDNASKTISVNDADVDRFGYGYGNPDKGYEEARPDSTKDYEIDPYGYDDARPDSGYGDNRLHLGYEDAAPDSNKHSYTADRYGYVDTTLDQGYRRVQPDSSSNEKHDPYGYGDAAPDLGYGDDSPDTGAKNGYLGGTSPDLGYGDAEPDSGRALYGYGRAAPDMGYGEAAPDQRDAPGYGDASHYGESEVDVVGYNDVDVGTAGHGSRRRRGPARTRSDESWLSESSSRTAATVESYGEYSQAGAPRRQRYRRRGSVTKYSIDAQDTVKQEYDEHANMIDQFRATMNQDATAGITIPANQRDQMGEEQLVPKPTSDYGAEKLALDQTSVAVLTEDSFDEPTGLPIRSAHSDDDLKNGNDSPRRFASRKNGNDGNKLMHRLRRRFSMSS
jgi:hypothetical protein